MADHGSGEGSRSGDVQVDVPGPESWWFLEVSWHIETLWGDITTECRSEENHEVEI